MSSYFRPDVCAGAAIYLVSYYSGYSTLSTVIASAAAFYSVNHAMASRRISYEQQITKDLSSLIERCKDMQLNTSLSEEERNSRLLEARRLQPLCQGMSELHQQHIQNILSRMPPLPSVKSQMRIALNNLMRDCQNIQPDVLLPIEERSRIVAKYNDLNRSCYQWGGDFQRDLDGIRRRIPPKRPPVSTPQHPPVLPATTQNVQASSSSSTAAQAHREQQLQQARQEIEAHQPQLNEIAQLLRRAPSSPPLSAAASVVPSSSSSSSTTAQTRREQELQQARQEIEAFRPQGEWDPAVSAWQARFRHLSGAAPHEQRSDREVQLLSEISQFILDLMSPSSSAPSAAARVAASRASNRRIAAATESTRVYLQEIARNQQRRTEAYVRNTEARMRDVRASVLPIPQTPRERELEEVKRQIEMHQTQGRLGTFAPIWRVRLDVLRAAASQEQRTGRENQLLREIAQLLERAPSSPSSPAAAPVVVPSALFSQPTVSLSAGPILTRETIISWLQSNYDMHEGRSYPTIAAVFRTAQNLSENDLRRITQALYEIDQMYIECTRNPNRDFSSPSHVERMSRSGNAIDIHFRSSSDVPLLGSGQPIGQLVKCYLTSKHPDISLAIPLCSRAPNYHQLKIWLR